MAIQISRLSSPAFQEQFPGKPYSRQPLPPVDTRMLIHIPSGWRITSCDQTILGDFGEHGFGKLEVDIGNSQYADDFERIQFTSELNTTQHIHGAWAELGKKNKLRNSCDNISDKARLGGRGAPHPDIKLFSLSLAQLSPYLFYSFPCFTSWYIEDDKLCHWLDLIMLNACEWLRLHNKNKIFQTLLGQTVTGRKANKYDEENWKQEEGCQAETTVSGKSWTCFLA